MPLWLRPVAACQVLVHGAIPIIVPCVAFRPQVAAIFAWLVAPADHGDAAASEANVAAVLDAMLVLHTRFHSTSVLWNAFLIAVCPVRVLYRPERRMIQV